MKIDWLHDTDLLHNVDFTALLAGMGFMSWQMINLIRPGGVMNDVKEIHQLEEVIRTYPQRVTKEMADAIKNSPIDLKKLVELRKAIQSESVIPPRSKYRLLDAIDEKLNKVPQNDIIQHVLDSIKGGTSMLLEHFHYFI